VSEGVAVESPRSRHVLIMGWDGVRDDERRAARTPNLDALAARGFAASVRVHEKNPTISGPVWTTVATGVYSDRHGVRDNDLRPYDPARLPDVLTHVRRAIPSATTFAGATWAPLVTTSAGGPVFAEFGFHPGWPAGGIGVDAIAAMDAAVVQRTVVELTERDHTAIFSYLEITDAVGHAEGVTARYRASIETCDEQLGTVLAAIESRPGRASEDWLVVVTTDHGHLDEGNHGGDTDEERSAWLVAAGPGVDSSSGAGVDHADVAVTVLDFLGVPAPGDLEGRSFASRTSARDMTAVT
jgi:arylsulfatase A-like enzyme